MKQINPYKHIYFAIHINLGTSIANCFKFKRVINTIIDRVVIANDMSISEQAKRKQIVKRRHFTDNPFL